MKERLMVIDLVIIMPWRIGTLYLKAIMVFTATETNTKAKEKEKIYYQKKQVLDDSIAASLKEKFYNYSISETDKSKTGAVIEFHMNKSTFCGTNGKATDAEWSEKSAKLGKQFAGYINRKFADFAKAVTASGDIIKVSILQPVYTDEDISRLIDLINTMYNAYLVASHIEVK